MSSVMLPAMPHSTDAVRKMPIATRYIRRRPTRSESLPNTAMLAVNDNRKPENTHEYVARPPSWETIVGIAVVTKVVSAAARKRLSINAAVMTRSRGGAGAWLLVNPAATLGSIACSQRRRAVLTVGRLRPKPHA